MKIPLKQEKLAFICPIFIKKFRSGKVKNPKQKAPGIIPEQWECKQLCFEMKRMANGGIEADFTTNMNTLRNFGVPPTEGPRPKKRRGFEAKEKEIVKLQEFLTVSTNQNQYLKLPVRKWVITSFLIFCLVAICTH